MTVSEWMEKWMQSELKGRVRQSSFQTYINMYKHHLRPGIGSCLITCFTTENIRSLIESLYKKGLADSTVRGIYRLLAAAMKCAHEEDIIRRNPCARIRLQRSMSREQRVLNKVESGRICDEAQVRTDLPTLLGMYTGMRLGEICALKWEDIDWAQKTIFVRRCAQRIAARSGSTEKTALIVGEPKSLKSRRIIPVPEFILILLKKRQTKGASGYVFGTETRAAEPRTIQRRFAGLTRRLGLNGVHFHTLRHSFATRLFELGVDIKTVSSLLGHSSARTTLKFYAHSLMDHQRAAIDLLAARK